MRARLATLGVAAVAGLTTLALATPAYADVQPAQPWQLIDTAAGGAQSPAAHSTIVDGSTVELTWQSGGSALGTSLETTNLGVAVESGDVVSVHYELLDGASAAAGAVRLFVYDHADGDTFSEAPTQFTFAPDGPASGTLQIAVNFDGSIGTAGLVYDTSNGGVPGTVKFTGLAVGGEMVAFKAEPQPALSACESYETPSGGDLCGYEETEGDLDCGDIEAADRPVKVLDAGKVDPYGLDADGDGVGCEVEPSDEPSEEPSVAPSASTPPAAGGGLPITGASLTGFAIGGSLLVGAGAALVLWRRRVRFTA